LLLPVYRPNASSSSFSSTSAGSTGCVNVRASASPSSGLAWPRFCIVGFRFQNQQIAPVDVIPWARQVGRQLFIRLDRAVEQPVLHLVPHVGPHIGLGVIRSVNQPEIRFVEAVEPVLGNRRERIEVAVVTGSRYAAGPHEAWIAADPFNGGFRVPITGLMASMGP
jgi:hypothetical protein